MYCQCSKGQGGKCDRPTICAEKVCAKTVEADLILAVVGEFDDLLAKKLAAEHIEFQTMGAVTVPGAPVPSVTVVEPTPPLAPPLALPEFGAPFDGAFGVTPGAPAVTVTGTDSAAIICVDGPIAAGTIFNVTYGAQKDSDNVVVQVQLNSIDEAAESYDVPAQPVVTHSDGKSFRMSFPDNVASAKSCYSMFSVCITPFVV